jgi:hypothetical protein
MIARLMSETSADLSTFGEDIGATPTLDLAARLVQTRFLRTIRFE